MKYKVWVEIEDQDIYEDVGEPMSAGEFDTLEEAQEFQESLTGTGARQDQVAHL